MPSEPPTPPGADPEPRPQVSFYVLEEASSSARLQLACRLTEKAYRAGQSVLIWLTDARELALLDELLWTFGDDRSFIPHEPLSALAEAPVQLSAGKEPAGPVNVLINLSAGVPPCASLAGRVLEIIDGDPARREAGRARFRAYRELGLRPVSHQLRGN